VRTHPVVDGTVMNVDGTVIKVGVIEIVLDVGVVKVVVVEVGLEHPEQPPVARQTLNSGLASGLEHPETPIVDPHLLMCESCLLQLGATQRGI